MRMKILFALLVALVMAKCFLLSYYIPVLVFLLAGFVWLTFHSPEISLFIVILSANDFFSLVSEDLFRIPGIFRFKDLLLILTFAILFIQILRKKIILKRTMFSRALWLILILVFIEMVLTTVFWNQSLNYTIRMGRRYLYYFLYFPLVYLLDNEQRVKRFFKFVVVSSVVYSLLMLLQYFMGPEHVLFRFASQVAMQKIGGQYVTRTYSGGSTLVLIVFFIYFFKLVIQKKFDFTNVSIVLLTFLGSIYLKFGRANIFGVIVGFLTTFFFLFDMKRKKEFLVVSAVSIVACFFLFETVRFIANGAIPNPISHSISMFCSGANDLLNRAGTFEFRLKDSADRIELIKSHLITGIGFIHPESGVLKIRTIMGGIVTVDSGIITLLLDFGLIGVFWLLILTGTVFQKARQLYFSNIEDSYKVIVAAIFSYYFSRFFSFLTLSEFVFQSGIVTIVVALFGLNYLGLKKDGPVNYHS